MRRAIDLLFAIVALALLLPFFALVVVAIWIDSPGSPFYLAQRCGQNRRVFRMWKFRSMIQAAGPVITGKNDPRITRLGRFRELRKSTSCRS